MMKSRYLTIAALAFAVAAPVSAQTYYGHDLTGGPGIRAANVNALAARTSFLASLTGVGTEDFEGFAAGATPPIALVFPGAGTATMNVGGAGIMRSTVCCGTNGVGRYPTSGTKWYETSSSTVTGSSFSIDFSAPVAAFGFYGTDIGDFGSSLTLRFFLFGGGTYDYLLPYVPSCCGGSVRDGSLLYAGYINTTTFTRVEFIGSAAPSSADFFGFDDMTVGSRESVTGVVPEPASIALVATGLLGLLAVSRRRRA